MKLTYIYHSCYVVETDSFAIIFDYYKDTGTSPLIGYVHDILLKKKERLYVLSSHFHPDHFNKDVLKWQQNKKDITYIFSFDILEEKKAKEGDACFLGIGDEYQDDHILVKAFGSTDVGSSFFLKIGDKQIFHAGDLNNWHWMDESTPEEVAEAENAYLKELELLAQYTNQLDLAMFPIDPRLGKEYMRGAEQFVSRIRTGILAPMHFAEAYDKVAAFKGFAEKHNCKLVELSHKGQQLDF